MRAASFRPSVPTQPWTLYDAIRKQLGLRCSESAFQLARLSAGLAIGGRGAGGTAGSNAAPHLGEPALHRKDAACEERAAPADQPPIHVARTGQRGLDCVAEHGR